MVSILNVSFQPESVWKEKIVGRGEDSDVLVRKLGDSVLALGVFDGLGGSGGRILKLPDGSEKSAARVASDFALRVTDEVLCDFFAPGVERQNDCSAAVERLAATLEQRLRERFEQHALEVESEQTIRGSLSRRLPTTLCVVVAIPGQVADAVELCCLWAGDSRVYVWTPARGLCQLTRDHARHSLDALTALRADAPMANFVTPDLSFYIDCHRIPVVGPCMVLCASDGCFHHFSSPMEFELAMLRGLLSRSDWGEAVAALGEHISRDANDDVSLAIAGLNWDSDDSRREAVEKRVATLVAAFNAIRTDSGDESTGTSREEWRETWWRDYRQAYESGMKPQKQPDAHS